MTRRARRLAAAWSFLVVSLCAVAAARAAWMEPDAMFRETQMLARYAARDTAGHSNDPARLDSLGAPLLKLGRLEESKRVYEHAVELAPTDAEALAALGKIALYQGRLDDADRMLSAASVEPGAQQDLLWARARRGDYAGAAEVATALDQQGRAELLRAMAEAPVYKLTGGPAVAKLLWVRAWPTPLVKVRLNNQMVLMAIDTGASDLLLDPSAVRRANVKRLAAERTEFWTGTRVAVGNAMVQKLDLGGMKLERVPAGVIPLRKYSLEVNPYGEPVAGVIGIEVLRRFTPTLDWKRHQLELRRLDAEVAVAPETPRVPFELWGLNELTVYGTVGDGRRMAMVVQSGVPSCGLGAPQVVFDELGIKAGVMSRLAKNAGSWLQGRSWSSVVVPAVTVGPVVQSKVAGWVGALDASELWRHGVRRDGLLAGDFFRDWRVTIDWRAQKLVVET